MSGFYPQQALLRQGQPCHNGDQQYDQDQTYNVEDYPRADHLGYGDHSGAVDDGVLRRAYRHHKAERGSEDRSEGGYQGVESSGRGYRDHDGHDNSGARRVGGSLGDEDGDDRRDRRDGEQAREAEGVGYAGAEGLREARVRQQYSERDAAAEEDYRPPVNPRRVVPVHGEASFGPVYRKEEQERRADDCDRPFVKPAVEHAVDELLVAKNHRREAWQDPETDGDSEGYKGVALAGREGAELAALLRYVLFGAADPAHLGPVEQDQDGAERDEHEQADRESGHDPAEEGDPDVGLLLDKGDPDKIGRRPDGREKPSDAGAVGDHEHERCTEAKSANVPIGI